MASPRRPPVRRASPTRPHRISQHDPPPRGFDAELDRVFDHLRAADPTGERFAAVLRETYDQLYDGQRTGRYSWSQLRKTEKTHMGTLVEINLHREFEFADGVEMDYLIEGVDTDCKFSQSLGGWEFPPEAYEAEHLCLVVWASDEASRWEAGLIRVAQMRFPDGSELLGPPNRDCKRKVTPHGESRIRWLYDGPTLPENLLLHIAPETRDRIFAAGRSAGGRRSGQAKINMLFRLVQRRIVNRASVLTVAQQKDSLKRARDARLPRHLGREGILVLGHQENDPLVAHALGLSVPRKGEFISGRVVPAEPGFGGPAAEIGGRLWRLADEDDPVVPAPVIPRGRAPADEDPEE